MVHIAHCKNINSSYELCDMSYWGKFALALFFIGGGISLKTNAGEQLIELQSDHLASVTLHPTDIPTATPFISLGEGGLTLRFDDLNSEYSSYNVRVIHCTFDWWASDLHPSEYLNGFYEASIANIEDSFGTMVNYTHYSIDLPNADLAWTISGNYCIEVFDPSYPDEILIRRRFIVYENLCTLDAEVVKPLEIAKQRTHQEVNFSVTEENYALLDPYYNLHTVVMQNGRYDNQLSGMQPRFIKGRELDYTNVGYVFAGGNAYRSADLKSLHFTSIGIASIIQGNDSYHHHMTQNSKRTYKYHKARQDLNGRFVVFNDRFDAYTGSDYTVAHFSLAMHHEMVGKDVFVFGDISGGGYPESHKMYWDSSKSSYRVDLLLKQGYYDYLYIVKNSRDSFTSPGNTADIEGDHFATNNLYSVFVYYADFEGYDRIIGFKQLNSGQQ